MDVGDEPIAVSLRTCADGRAIEVADKLAAGAAEALELDVGPARRISAIVREATSNAVEHAYVDLPLGDVEITMAIRRSPPGSEERDEVAIAVRDFGNGCALGPTTSEPPGLGLSMISELSEGLTISSRKHRGTKLDASIRIPGNDDESGRQEPASRGTLLEFTDPVFLLPVIPRALAVHASSAGGSVDSVRAAISCGRGIAGSIDGGSIAANGATLSIDQPEDVGSLEIRLGPMPEASAEPLLERLRSALDPDQPSRIEPWNGHGRDDSTVLIEMPLH